MLPMALAGPGLSMGPGGFIPRVGVTGLCFGAVRSLYPDTLVGRVCSPACTTLAMISAPTTAIDSP